MRYTNSLYFLTYLLTAYPRKCEISVGCFMRDRALLGVGSGHDTRHAVGVCC